ncbi:MAG: type I phosphomannose isomerase catalytic subunit [Lachnospira sp.]|nr:type I phosphomannose isomerase catalytic subunit [Lachnospira sp.]
MKCVILAGGSGDSLWPLSRRQFPKQFMKIKEGRSLLQETVVRNMPFCEEFIIVTNESYKNIINGQMKAFQSLRYRVLLEGIPKGTAAAVLLGTMFANPSELVLVVNSDNLIDGDGYKEAILEAKEYAKDGFLAVLGVKPETQSSTYGYILREKEDVKKFIARMDFDEYETEGLMGYGYDEGYLWNSGMLVFRAGDMTNTARQVAPELYSACRTAKRKVPAIRRSVRFSESVMQSIPHGSIETLLLEKCNSIKVVEVAFDWMDVGNASNLDEFGNNIKSDCVIKYDCDNVNVINSASRQLVVANDVKDLVVVNTDDATYVSSKKSADNIKQIMKENMDTYEAFFDYNRTTYKEWGTQEILNYSQGYKVRKLTVFPGMSMTLHQHEKRTEHWSIVEGVATITLGNETLDYNKYESVFIPVGVKHKVANKTDKNVVIIEIGIGDNISDTDLVKIYNQDGQPVSGNYVRLDKSPIVRLEPAFKDNLWGGTKIRDVYGKKCDYDVIGESWELSAHPDGQSRIAEGRYKGMLFNEYLNIIGKDALGWKCQAQDRFPILIKFIDAKQALSIQIHPDDEYALENENEYGKNEMWYVVDSEPGAYLYCGLSRDASRDEIEERIANNTITDILNRVDVKAGDVVMVKAGTIHAIGAGVFICEIQQNSNSTYRMYDYDRRDKFGNPRELHIKKALDVVDTHKYVKDNKSEIVIARNEHFVEERLVQCKYFEVYKYEISDEARIAVDEASFVSVLFITGSGTIQTDDFEKVMPFNAGDSFFISAGLRYIIVKGQATMIVTRV